MTVPAPRLRVERLVIVESCSPRRLIRDVKLHEGLNIVWAEELAAGIAGTEVERAGHGVGKSTISLMLRAVLGDEGAAVKTMRVNLAEHYASGGVAAEIVTGTERFAVFRSFGSHSFVLPNGTVEDLFEESAKSNAIELSTYIARLGEKACLQHVMTRTLPVTGQGVEWGHVLCWISRDQALGLRHYFEWRIDDGAGLRRKAKDPPALVRLILGLLPDSEVNTEAQIAGINRDLLKARDTLFKEEQRGTNTRDIVETQLRAWAGVSDSLQMVADDLFADSVETEMQRKIRLLEASNKEDRAAAAELDREIIELAVDIKTQDRIASLARLRWDETVALRTRDAEALQQLRQKRDALLTVSGMCQFGGVAYSDCNHVQAQRDTVALRSARDIGALTRAVDAQDEREASEKAQYEREQRALAKLLDVQSDRINRRTALNIAMEMRTRRLGEVDSVRNTLRQWQESQEAPETERLRTARAAVAALERSLEAANGAKVSAREQLSEREQQISKRMSQLAEVFGVTGRYVSTDERRPFQMIGAEGDAYTVLEILLGDLACAEDGMNGGGAHPGILIFDCPREREMSSHLYDRFVELLDEVCKRSPGLQVVLTTTTPPPGSLREPPTRILKLSHASDDELLLRRRIANLLAPKVLPLAQHARGEEA
jgi:hypothetical protein